MKDAHPIAKEITAYLKENDLSLIEADLGVAPQTLYNITSGRRVPRESTVKKIRERLGIAPLPAEPPDEPPDDGGEIMAREVRVWLEQHGYGLRRGAMALQLRREVLDDVLQGNLPHRNIITHLCGKVEALLRWSALLLDQRREQERQAA